MIPGVSWLREEEVPSAILKGTFTKKAPPPALEIIAFVRRAIIKRKAPLGDDVLLIVPFGDWFALLESKAENASEDDLAKIVSRSGRCAVLHGRIVADLLNVYSRSSGYSSSSARWPGER